MIKTFIGLWLAMTATLVWANCTSHQYYYNGRYVTCTTCCYSGNCNTTCF